LKQRNRFLKKYPYYDSSLPLEQRIDLLLMRLTLKEKFKLLSGRVFSWWKSSSIYRLKIPSLNMSDGPHGISFHSSFRFMTKFPCSKCLSASWNPHLASNVGAAIAEEAKAIGKQLLLAPGMNIDRTPLNGRTFEYFSEDPFLTKEFAVAYVKGVQSRGVGATIKHFIANNQETNRFTVNVQVDVRTLHEIYLRAFRDVVREADPLVVMGSYNKVNGIYACENKELLQETLFNLWGFKGFVVSDWYATKFLKRPEQAIQAGLSLEMPKAIVYTLKRLKKAFKEGLFSREELDAVVRRFLRVLFRVGLFDEKPRKSFRVKVNSPVHQELAHHVAEEGMVLLKNEGNFLPLNINHIKSVGIFGPFSSKKMGKFLYGGSAAVVPPFEISPKKGIINKVKERVKIVKKPAEADCCLVFVGISHAKGGDCENFDRPGLSLPKQQNDLILEVVEQNPQTVVVLINGSPITMTPWLDKVPAVLEAWHPGMMGGNAIANILFGAVNPSGKLPITFPKTLKDSPAHASSRSYPGNDDVFYEEGIYVGYRHFDKKSIAPLFPFGFGLSYSKFSYKDLLLSSSEIAGSQELDVVVEVTNDSPVAGAEIVQLYVKDDEASIDRPVKELRGFKKVFLNPYETATVNMTLGSSDLEFFDAENFTWRTEPGSFTIFVGPSSRVLPLEGKFEFR